MNQPKIVNSDNHTRFRLNNSKLEISFGGGEWQPAQLALGSKVTGNTVITGTERIAEHHIQAWSKLLEVE